MICEKCKHEIGPDYLKCPNCGADNLFALKHAQNIKQFDKEFVKTENEVAGSAKKIAGLGKKAALLVILLIAIIAMRVIAASNYAGSNKDEAAKKDAEKNATQYASKMDSMLENGEYMEFANYCYGHEIMNSGAEEYERFRCVKYTVAGYYNCVKIMEAMILRSKDGEYFDRLDTDVSNFCMYLDGFERETLVNMKEQEKDEVYLSYILDMENELKAAMRTYFSMDDAELTQFLSLSKAKKAVKLEEILRNE